jgi:AcrR family transcriptional regulator
LNLFATQGFDATDVSAIARKAGVSTRTFLRYFPTKESALYRGESSWLQSVLDIYPTQPGTLNDLDALIATFTALAPRVQKSRRLLKLYQRAVESSLTLRGRDDAHQHEIIEVLAGAVAARCGPHRPHDGCKLLAAIALMVFRRSLDSWLSGPAGAELADVIRTEFEILSDQFAS